LLALNDALEKLERKHPLQAQVVKLRYFAGMNNEEIAELIGVSLSSVIAQETSGNSVSAGPRSVNQLGFWLLFRASSSAQRT
jgi:hypothetical protein